uniref:Uncharacterized protein n=1 Tax=virus sp. ctBS918 TaxID=2825807 RepID=A0A8S5RPA1_9VIRU|nr:MAG TPA: hypothetical protein [virus sp. ctBS918]
MFSKHLSYALTMDFVLCPCPLDNYNIIPFKILFKYFLRYFIIL